MRGKDWSKLHLLNEQENIITAFVGSIPIRIWGRKITEAKQNAQLEGAQFSPAVIGDK